MSENFQKAVSRTLGHEGGYSNDPLDPGGETMWGITARTARSWGYPGEMRFLPREKAVKIYQDLFWEPISGDKLPFPLAYQLFDAGVNSSPRQAVLWLQRALGVNPDGIIGPVTLAAVTQQNPLLLGFEFIRRRQTFQQSLVNWPHHGKGWTNRNFANLETLLKDSLNVA